MFFLMRAVLVVGVIFYLSPVRGPDPAGRPVADAALQAERFWEELSAQARQAVIDEFRTSAATKLAQNAERLSERATADTLRPQDRNLPWRGETKRP